MRKILVLLLLLFALVLFMSACGTEVPQSETQTEEFALTETGFVSLELMEDVDDFTEAWEIFEIMGLRFLHAPHYAVMADTNGMGHLSAFGDFGQVSIMVTVDLEPRPTTPANIGEMLASITALVDDYEILEEGDLLIHGIVWNYMTIQYEFVGQNLFNTMLFATANGIVYTLTYLGGVDQMEALRADRNAVVSSLLIGANL